MPDVLGALKRARTSELEIQYQLEHIEMLHRITRRALSPDAAIDAVEKLAGLERRLNSTIDEMVDAKREALEYVSFLTGEERLVIEGYYLLGKSWQKLSAELYISERKVFNLRKKGIARLLERFGGEPPENAGHTTSTQTAKE